jgi:hypothetical protein
LDVRCKHVAVNGIKEKPEDGGSIPGRGQWWNFFSSPPRPDPLWGPPTFLLEWVKRSGREADHSPPSSAGVKNAWSYNSTPPYVFKALCSVKQSTGTTLPYLIACRKSSLFKQRCFSCVRTTTKHGPTFWCFNFTDLLHLCEGRYLN